MKQKMFKSTSILVSLAVLLTFLAMSIVFYQKTYDQMTTAVRNECAYVKMAVESMGEGYLNEEVANLTSSRITLIDVDGKVLFESEKDAENIANHGQRPEFQEAAEKGESSLERYSSTLDHQTFYCAMRLENGKIIRVASTVDSVFKTMVSSMTLLVFLIGAVVILSIFLVYRQISKMIEPINHLDLEHPLSNIPYEELKPLLYRLYQQNEQIERQVKTLKRNQQEFLAITENMKDGLVVTNKTIILSINRAAKKFFGVRGRECVNHGIDTVSDNPALKEVLDLALKGQYDAKVIQIFGRALQLTANPVQIAGKVKGAVILMMDVTEKQQAEQMRREFSANVSHELKTPLMSISGYAEIIENGMVRAGDIPVFAGRIHQEANRLSMLVEDIIRLSSLDEGSDFPVEKLNLKELVTEVSEHLKKKIEKKEIVCTSDLEDAEITGVRQIVYEIIYNLCDNAVKYNKQNGKIHVCVKKSENQVHFSVQDTGIGIAPEDQSRIFERFYRVDKSHSRATGGTGLGLSIVKHGAALHHADIRLESKLGEGTNITVVFQKEFPGIRGE